MSRAAERFTEVEGPCGHYYSLALHRVCPHCNGRNKAPEDDERDAPRRRRRSRARPVSRLPVIAEPRKDLIETHEAAALIGISVSTAQEYLGPLRQGKTSAQLPASHLYRRADIEMVVRLRSQYPSRIGVGLACELIAWLRAQERRR